MTLKPTSAQSLREIIMRLIERRLALEPCRDNTAALARAKQRLDNMGFNELDNAHQTLSTTLIFLEQRKNRH